MEPKLSIKKLTLESIDSDENKSMYPDTYERHMQLWKFADSLTEIFLLNIASISGNLASPLYVTDGSPIDPEGKPLIPDLVKMNMNGYFTIMSQPGSIETDYLSDPMQLMKLSGGFIKKTKHPDITDPHKVITEQRECVEGIMPNRLFDKLIPLIEKKYVILTQQIIRKKKKGAIVTEFDIVKKYNADLCIMSRVTREKKKSYCINITKDIGSEGVRYYTNFHITDTANNFTEILDTMRDNVSDEFIEEFKDKCLYVAIICPDYGKPGMIKDVAELLEMCNKK